MSTKNRENRKTYEAFASACVHGELPACSVACPLNLDVREIVKRVQEGNFNAAYKAFRTKAVFPEIVANICDEPCRAGCIRRDLDESLALRMLERACVDLATAKTPSRFHLPRKTQKIAIIGAGLSGLSCAVRLAAKNYPVTVYEKTDKLGGRLWSLMDPEIFLPSIQTQLEATDCEIRFETEAVSLGDIEYDAVVVATGADGDTYGLLEGLDTLSYGTREPGTFLIGNVLGTTSVEDIAQGRIAAFSVEKYLKVGAMDGTPETFRQTECKIIKDLSTIERARSVVPAQAEAYDEEEAVAEAARCLLCDCTICSDGCELFGHLYKMPKVMVADAMTSLHAKRSCGAIRAMSSCNLCGLCGKTCPQNIDIGRFYQDFRIFKREDDLLPLAFHDFFMADMQFANEEGYLAHPAPGHTEARYLFFPGCQLAASDPRHVELTYHHLLECIPDMALILGCCGAPAEWAAETTERGEVIERLRAEWERLGRPEFVFACSTCKIQFERRLPEVKGVSLYDLLLDVGLPELDSAWQPEACVFDPCSSRFDPSMQKSVRKIAKKVGVNLTELPYSGEKAQCCGWGGHIGVANPKLFNTIVDNRISAHDLPYITYCANCQEVFSRAGKDSRHVLDLVLGLDKTEHPLPSLGQRRTNRLVTKQNVLEREWGLDMKDAAAEERRAIEGLIISDELLSTMHKDRIVEDNVYKTIVHADTTGNVVFDPNRDVFIGHLRIGSITYWVEYKKSDQGYVLVDVFSHRAEIIER